MEQPQLGRFGIPRLAATGDDPLAAMLQERTTCLAALTEDRAETRQFTKFLDNQAAAWHEMQADARPLTARRVAGQHVLVIGDTSTFNFATRTAARSASASPATASRNHA